MEALGSSLCKYQAVDKPLIPAPTMAILGMLAFRAGWRGMSFEDKSIDSVLAGGKIDDQSSTGFVLVYIESAVVVDLVHPKQASVFTIVGSHVQ